MINKITKEEYPEQWQVIIDDMDGSSHDEMEHRRGNSFYITPRYVIDEELVGYEEQFGVTIPKELIGLWEADTCTWSDDWGLDAEPTTLYRVNKVEKEVVTKVVTFERVKD